MPRYYPIMMDLKGRECVVVGGGEVAARKAEMLAKCGGFVKVIAPEINGLLAPLVKDGRVKHIKDKYSAEHLKGASIVVGATDDESVNRAVYKDGTDIGIPVNIVDVPELCSFIVPSVVEQGDLILAISTSGKSPAMSKRIRKELQKQFGPEYAGVLKLLGEIRELLMKSEPDYKKRMQILTDIVNSDILDRVRSREKLNPAEIIEETLGRH